jgi:hypothetical protein
MFQLSDEMIPRVPSPLATAASVELVYTKRRTVLAFAAASRALMAPAMVAGITWRGSVERVMTEAQWTTPEQPRAT